MSDSRGPRWALARSREVFDEAGVRGVWERGSGYVSRRRVTTRKRLPAGPVDSSSWPVSVTIIAGKQPPQCYRYRVLQKLEAAAGGVPVRVVDPRRPDEVADAVQLARVLVIYRQADGPVMRSAVAEARRLGIPVVYEADDAVHDRTLMIDNPNLTTLPPGLRRSVIRGADRHLALLRRCDHVLASTPALAAELGRHVPGSAFVMDNGIDDQMRRIRDGVVLDPAPPRQLPDGRIRIGYGSGSRAHDADLALAATGLAQVMAADPRVELVVVGPVATPDQLRPFGERIQHVKELDYGEFLRQLAACDLTIAPLLDLPFNLFKSQVKLLEAAVVGTPVIASPTLYSDYIVDGVTGLIASDSEWAATLARLVDDQDLRRRLAAAAAESLSDLYVERRPRSQWNGLIEALT